MDKNSQSTQLKRKAMDELAELRDVYEGYQKYIVNAEQLSSNNSQKLNLQLETNEVTFLIFIFFYSFETYIFFKKG